MKGHTWTFALAWRLSKKYYRLRDTLGTVGREGGEETGDTMVRCWKPLFIAGSW